MKASAAGTRDTTAHRHGQSSQPAIFSSAHTATATTSAAATDWQTIAAKKNGFLASLCCVLDWWQPPGDRTALTAATADGPLGRPEPHAAAPAGAAGRRLP